MTTLQCGERECRAPQLTEKELEQKVKEAPLWELSPDRKSISRTFVAKNFAEGLKFFNAVAQLAEEWNHHPDLHLTDYRTVRVVLSTHAIQGLSALDFSLAARIDKIDVAYSPKWLRENPLPSPV
ncbi:unnamed protein product [Sphagnum jensenii]|uniref:Uncharacterized protein n=2 Tax=Sphagnum jensenii TaxID=128206 RepID=A0ABP0W1P2_9BRYO